MGTATTIGSARAVRPGTWVLIGLALLLALVLAGHRLVPDLGGIGTLLDSVLPWLGLAVPVLAVPALFRGRRIALAALVVPVVVWGVMFGPTVLPKSVAGSARLTVVSQNIDAGNPDPCGALRALAARNADLVAVQELAGPAQRCSALDADYPYHVRVGTVGLWSKNRIDSYQPLRLGLAWDRSLRAEIGTGRGQLTVYVVHLPSIRLGATTERDTGLRVLAAQLASEPAGPVLVVGDFNTASTDRAFGELAGYQDSQRDAGTGFGFTWPAAFPLTRPDHMLGRGLRAVSSDTLPANGSDHRGITAAFA